MTSVATPDSPSVKCEVFEYAVILSQACDLTQAYEGTEVQRLPDVLLCQASVAGSVRHWKSKDGSRVINSKQWERIKINKDDRYHFLERCPGSDDATGKEIPELTIDFKRYFTLPTDELYAWIKHGHTVRRAVLNTPYMEHLCDRFAYYLARIGLPREHVSEAGT